MKVAEIADHPDYPAAAAAAAASKATIFLFIGTFLYMLFGTDVSPGVIGGALFFFIGIFAASLLIAAPLFALRAKFPRLGIVISLVDIAVTILATWWVYMWLFG